MKNWDWGTVAFWVGTLLFMVTFWYLVGRWVLWT